MPYSFPLKAAVLSTDGKYRCRAAAPVLEDRGSTAGADGYPYLLLVGVVRVVQEADRLARVSAVPRLLRVVERRLRASGQAPHGRRGGALTACARSPLAGARGAAGRHRDASRENCPGRDHPSAGYAEQPSAHRAPPSFAKYFRNYRGDATIRLAAPAVKRLRYLRHTLW